MVCKYKRAMDMDECCICEDVVIFCNYILLFTKGKNCNDSYFDKA